MLLMNILIAFAALALSFACTSVIPKHQTSVKEYFAHPKDQQFDALSSRIIGGIETVPHEYPFQTALAIYEGDDVYFCSGTVVTDEWILTSANCIDMNPYSILITLGAHNLTGMTDELLIMDVTEYIIHEDWNPDLLQNDIALLRMSNSVIFNDFIQPVVLPNGIDNYEGDIGFTMGWGRTEDGQRSMVLKQFNNTILSNEECASASPEYEQVIVDTHICLSGAGSVGTCDEDSGGPLLVDGVQVGIISFGTKDCSLGMPSVYTRVTEFYDWIVEHVKSPRRVTN